MILDVTCSRPDSTYPPSVLAPNVQFAPGSRVIFCGLVKQQSLNNCLGVVEQFLFDQARYQVRPLSRQAKRLTRSKFVAVSPCNLKLVPPSAFVAELTINDQKCTPARVPLECDVQLDEWQEQLVVSVLISDFWGEEFQSKIIEDLDLVTKTNDTSHRNVLEIVNTPIDFEEPWTNHVELEGDEVLIVPKNIFAQLYDAMINYELLTELDVTVPVGLHGELPLCRLRFPYDLSNLAKVETPSTANSEDAEGNIDDNNCAGKRSKIMFCEDTVMENGNDI